jgi:hypothetical protein
VAGAGMFPALLLFGVIAGASPALCEDVTLEGLRDSYEEASNAGCNSQKWVAPMQPGH